MDSVGASSRSAFSPMTAVTREVSDSRERDLHNLKALGTSNLWFCSCRILGGEVVGEHGSQTCFSSFLRSGEDGNEENFLACVGSDLARALSPAANHMSDSSAHPICLLYNTTHTHTHTHTLPLSLPLSNILY